MSDGSNPSKRSARDRPGQSSRQGGSELKHSLGTRTPSAPLPLTGQEYTHGGQTRSPGNWELGGRPGLLTSPVGSCQCPAADTTCSGTAQRFPGKTRQAGWTRSGGQEYGVRTSPKRAGAHQDTPFAPGLAPHPIEIEATGLQRGLHPLLVCGEHLQDAKQAGGVRVSGANPPRSGQERRC